MARPARAGGPPRISSIVGLIFWQIFGPILGLGETLIWGWQMTIATPGPGGLDYQPCRYGTSKISFRGPKRRLDHAYIAALGGAETFGTAVERPYPALLEQSLGLQVINLGCANAGPDLFLNDPQVMEIAAGASVCVMQATGAQNLSNRFYTVHPRRNDRFLRASTLMQQIFRDVDFTEFSFTRHMLESLQRFAPERFEILRTEVQEAWVARMRTLADRVQGRMVLIWAEGAALGPLGGEPLFITPTMIARLKPHVANVVHIPSPPGQAGPVPDAAAHQAMAQALRPVLEQLI